MGKWKLPQIAKKFVKKLRGNDIAVKIYVSFAVVLLLTGILTGAIFMKLYRQNYLQSYSSLLIKQGKTIANRVSSFERNDKLTKFQRYNVYVDEMENAEHTDVWIISNENAKQPLNQNYANVQSDNEALTEEMREVIDKAYKGRVTSNSSYDDAYGMFILRVAVPIFRKGTKDVSGAVMMVCMLDKQHMGINEGKYLIVVSVMAAILLSYVVAFIFSNYLSKPLSRISRDINRISSGDYSSQKAKRPDTQIGKIETTLNSLAVQLNDAEVERENLEQVRRDFFANISHELRTPITVIRGYAETLNDGVLTKQEAIEDMYRRMLAECQGMERLVGDLFILSKMQNPDFQIEKEPVSLVQIFGDISRSTSVIGKEKNITLVEDFPEDDFCIMLGDYIRLRQMFMVIIDNAIKFSNENGHIYVTIQKNNNKLKVSIRDEGVGISEKELPFIFEKFYKSKLKQNEKGTGLGLMIARQIALRHDGDVTVQSELGKGTTFFFEFDECTSLEDFE